MTRKRATLGYMNMAGTIPDQKKHGSILQGGGEIEPVMVVLPDRHLTRDLQWIVAVLEQHVDQKGRGLGSTKRALATARDLHEAAIAAEHAVCPAKGNNR